MLALDHIGIVVLDIQKARRFYDAVLPFAGYALLEERNGFLGYGTNDPYTFHLIAGTPAVPGLHLCFSVVHTKQVDEFHHAALAAGGGDNGAPGIRAEYAPDYYAAFVYDPDGNNIEFLVRHAGACT